jgi:hypothetical protein
MANVIVVKHTMDEGLTRNTTIIVTSKLVVVTGDDVLVMADDLSKNGGAGEGKEVAMLCENSTTADALDLLEKLAQSL